MGEKSIWFYYLWLSIPFIWLSSYIYGLYKDYECERFTEFLKVKVFYENIVWIFQHYFEKLKTKEDTVLSGRQEREIQEMERKEKKVATEDDEDELARFIN